jgi:hypothetical protein
MFLLSFIPDSLLLWCINSILIAGLIGTAISVLFKFFLQWAPWIIPYRTLLQIVSLVLLVAGVYFSGGYWVEMEWRERVKEAEAKVAVAEAKSKEVNTIIQTKVVEKIKIVKDVQVVIQDRIVEKEKIIDAECKVAPEAIDILNEASKKPKVKK